MTELGILTGKNISELREMTYERIRSAQDQALISKTKKELIELELQRTEFADPTTGKDSQNGQVWRLTPFTDAEGKIIRKERVDWTYYPTGEVDTITILELDALDQLISQKKIKHFTNGRQPILVPQ